MLTSWGIEYCDQSIKQRAHFGVFSNLASSSGTLHFRNLVFAPLSEEIVFRGLMVAVMVSEVAAGGEGGVGQICALVPAWFALAHVHHLLEKILVQHHPVTSALLSTLVQITYTSIFGVIATYLHLRTGSLAAPITSHVVCNFVGLPDVGFLVPPGQNNSVYISYMHQYRILLVVMHALGLVLFFAAIGPATQSMASASVFWKVLEARRAY
jgi:prenyl protein peptidase